MNLAHLPTAARRPVLLHGASRAKGASYARIVSTATVVPEQVVSNEQIIESHGHSVSASAMARITGVAQRRVAEPGVTDTELLARATVRCLAQANTKAEELSKLLVTKFLGDRALPMTAALLQKKLDCGVAVQSYDIDGGIHSFIHAVEAASSLMAMGEGPIVIASGGVVNRVVSRKDPRVAFQYGDGAAAIMLSCSDEPHILATYSFTNPAFSKIAIGFEIRGAFPNDIHQTRDYERFFDLYAQSDWKPAQQFVLDAMRHTANALLEASGKHWNQVDLFLVTETHHRLWQSIIRDLGIEVQRTVSLLSKYGNTMSAMLPMQLDEALRTGAAGPGSLVMMLSVGEGLSGGGVLVEC